ncbi:MAG: hypothetical protein ACM3JK_02230, partial [Betaproteobacteria bacterium]
MELTTHTTFPDATFLPEWNALVDEGITRAPFLRHDYLTGWWHGLGGGEWTSATLSLVTAHDADHLLGIAPLFRAVNREGQPA